MADKVRREAAAWTPDNATGEVKLLSGGNP